MPKIGYSANGFGKAMEASVKAVDALDAVEADGGGLEDQGPRDGRRVLVATVLAEAFPRAEYCGTHVNEMSPQFQCGFFIWDRW